MNFLRIISFVSLIAVLSISHISYSMLKPKFYKTYRRGTPTLTKSTVGITPAVGTGIRKFSKRARRRLSRAIADISKPEFLQQAEDSLVQNRVVFTPKAVNPELVAATVKNQVEHELPVRNISMNMCFSIKHRALDKAKAINNSTYTYLSSSKKAQIALVAGITALASVAVWKFYQKRSEKKRIELEELEEQDLLTEKAETEIVH